jgi:SAM-dependent methyltransferase
MTYILDRNEESKRLRDQNLQGQYNIHSELALLSLELEGKTVLDAGCGIGSLTTALIGKGCKELHACDFSAARLEVARETYPSVHFFQADLTDMNVASGTYDMVFIRSVLQHTTRPKDIVKELRRILKPGGEIIVIDDLGLIFDLHTEDPWLKTQLRTIEASLPVDLNIGKKLPRMLTEANFDVLECQVKPLIFHGADMELEVDNMEKRFLYTKDLISAAIGAEQFQRFTETYVDEMRRSVYYVFFKFLVKAKAI